VCSLLLLSACSAVSVPVSVADQQLGQRQRAALIREVSSWSIVARISIDDGEEGGSGRLQWVVRNDHSTMNFHGAMGRGAWQLENGPDGVLLRRADGVEHTAVSVDELVQQQIGWPVPVSALQWWIRGLVAPGEVDEQQLEPRGLLKSLSQFGWQIDFNRYTSDSGVAMPTRLDATHKNFRVKLAISRWHMPMNDVIKN